MSDLVILYRDDNGFSYILAGYGAEYAYSCVGTTIPDLVQKIEENWCEFTAGELSLTCRNDSGFWDTELADANPLARYNIAGTGKSCRSIIVQRSSTVIWEGDIDLPSVAFNRKQRTVSFTVFGKMKRLEKYDASVVRRLLPQYSEWGDTGTVTGTLGVATTTNVFQRGVVFDSEPWTTDQFKGHILYIRYNIISESTVTPGTGRKTFYTKQAVGGSTVPAYYPAPSLQAPLAPVVALAGVAGNVTVGTHYYKLAWYDGKGTTVGGGVSALVTTSAGNAQVRVTIPTLPATAIGAYIYRTKAGGGTGSTYYRLPIGVAGAGAGVYLDNYADGSLDSDTAPTESTVAMPGVRVRATSRTSLAWMEGVVDNSTTGVNPGVTILVDAYAGSASSAWNLSLGEISADLGTGNGWQARLITGNSATTLTLSNNVTLLAGTNYSYMIRPFHLNGSSCTDLVLDLPRKLSFPYTVVGPTGLDLRIGDKLRVISYQTPILRQTAKSTWYSRKWDATANDYTIALVGPVWQGTKMFLGANEVWLDEDLATYTLDAGDRVAVFAPGDSCLVTTPYFRDKSIATLATYLFNAAGITTSANTYDAVGRRFMPAELKTVTPDTSYGICTITGVASADVPYADFEGKNVAEALKTLAAISGCYVAALPDRYIFQPRDMACSQAQTIGSLEYCATDLAEGLFHEQSYDHVSVEGADGRVATRGLTKFPSNGLEISSDMIATYDWVKYVADRTWALVGGRRRAAKAAILAESPINLVADPSFEGTLPFQASHVEGTSSRWYWNVTPSGDDWIDRNFGWYDPSRMYVFDGVHSLNLSTDTTNNLGVAQTIVGWAAGDILRLSAMMMRRRAGGAGGIIPPIGTVTCDLEVTYGSSIPYAVITARSLTLSSGDSSEFVSKVAATYTLPSNTRNVRVKCYVTGSPPNLDAAFDKVLLEVTNRPARPSLLSRCFIGDREYHALEVAMPLSVVDRPDRIGLDLVATFPRPVLTSGGAQWTEDTLETNAVAPQPWTISTMCEAFSGGGGGDPELPIGAFTSCEAVIEWPYPDGQVAYILRQLWPADEDRPDDGVIGVRPQRTSATQFTVSWTESSALTVGTSDYYVDFQVLYVDGRLTAPSNPVLVTVIAGV